MNIFNKNTLIFLAACFIQSILSGSVNAEDNPQDNCDIGTSAFEKRLCAEDKLIHQPFVLVPYKPNYIIGSLTDDLELQNPIFEDFETKFQISFKVALGGNSTDSKWLWYFGYTQLSVWQMLNFDHSAPFRDTNYEPELMLVRLSNAKILGWKMRLINFGLIDHHSNGQVPPYSRSWNRSYVDFLFERGSNYITLKSWARWKEKSKADVNDYEGDDNPDILQYMGYGELKLFHAGEEHNLALTVRDSSRAGGQGTYQLDWSFPVFKSRGLRFYVQYFNGYGETLIDYNIKRERIGMGLMLTDWL